jgi:catechol 2,3-dioxygenase-like lactoylglutathione lyase family enzyme
MKDPELLATVPVLPVADIAKSVAFYRDHLGFSQAFEVGPYAGIQRDAVELHLDGTSAHRHSVVCRINVRGVDGLYAEIEPHGVVAPDEPLETKSHGLRQFTVVDLCGNRITFAEPATP